MSSLKGLIPKDKWHYWLTQMSRPQLSHSMVYGWGCRIIGSFNLLTTSTEIRFFLLLQSTMKCSGVLFTHICEWKRRSPSSRSSGSFGCIVMTTMVALGSSSMIYLPLYFFESKSKSSYDSFSLRSTTNDCFE
jgi:hypothetical protein